MTRWRTPFASPLNNPECWYDIIRDYELIEASFAEQYGIRLRREDDMSWGEFVTLLAGLNEKTALGRVIAIRSEKDPKILKQFTPEQRRIRAEWRRSSAKAVSRQDYYTAMDGFKAMFIGLAKEAKA